MRKVVTYFSHILGHIVNAWCIDIATPPEFIAKDLHILCSKMGPTLECIYCPGHQVYH